MSTPTVVLPPARRRLPRIPLPHRHHRTTEAQLNALKHWNPMRHAAFVDAIALVYDEELLARRKARGE